MKSFSHKSESLCWYVEFFSFFSFNFFSTMWASRKTYDISFLNIYIQLVNSSTWRKTKRKTNHFQRLSAILRKAFRPMTENSIVMNWMLWVPMTHRIACKNYSWAAPTLHSFPLKRAEVINCTKREKKMEIQVVSRQTSINRTFAVFSFIKCGGL